jgi:hypothetical protein
MIDIGWKTRGDSSEESLREKITSCGLLSKTRPAIQGIRKPGERRASEKEKV